MSARPRPPRRAAGPPGSPTSRARCSTRAVEGRALRGPRRRRARMGAAPRYELVVLLPPGFPARSGLVLRGWLYPWLLGACGRNVSFGTGVALRHPGRSGSATTSPSTTAACWTPRDRRTAASRSARRVFLGRHTLLACKEGDIVLEDGVNVSYNCAVFSASSVRIGAETLLAAYCYVVGGGHDFDRTDVPVVQQARPVPGDRRGPGRLAGGRRDRARRRDASGRAPSWARTRSSPRTSPPSRSSRARRPAWSGTAASPHERAGDGRSARRPARGARRGGAPRRVPRGLARLGLGLLVSGAILVYLFGAQGADPRALVPLVRAISLPGLAAYVAVSAAGLVLRDAALLASARAPRAALAARAGDRRPQPGRRPRPGPGRRGRELPLPDHRAARAARSRPASPPSRSRSSSTRSPVAPLLVLGAAGGGQRPAAAGRPRRREPRAPARVARPRWLLAPVLRLARAVAAAAPGARGPARAAPRRGGRGGRAARARPDPGAGARPVAAPAAHEVRRLLLSPPGAPGLAGRGRGRSSASFASSSRGGGGDGRVPAAADAR